MKIAVIGAGAIGGVTAALMAESGLDVTLICRRANTAEIIQNKGLSISGKRGSRQIRLKATADVAGLDSEYDYCLIATKAYDLEAMARAMLPKLKPQGLMVSLQNGMCLDALMRTTGKERVAGSVVSWSSTKLGEAKLEITGEGGFIIGRPEGGRDGVLLSLKQALDCAFPTMISDHILSDMYSKLIINSGITCGGAMSGQTLGRMLAARKPRAFFIHIVREGMAVAEALGIKVPPFGGKLDYYKFIRGNDILSELRRHVVLFVVGLKYRKLKSSSLTALQRGEKTEVDFLNGWIEEQGEQLGIPTPVNSRVVDIIRQIEVGQRKISPANIADTL